MQNIRLWTNGVNLIDIIDYPDSRGVTLPKEADFIPHTIRELDLISRF